MNKVKVDDKFTKRVEELLNGEIARKCQERFDKQRAIRGWILNFVPVTDDPASLIIMEIKSIFQSSLISTAQFEK